MEIWKTTTGEVVKRHDETQQEAEIRLGKTLKGTMVKVVPYVDADDVTISVDETWFFVF